MGKKMTRAGMELRRAIRADVDANPAADHLQFRSKFHVGEGIVESALTKTIAEWDVLIAESDAIAAVTTSDGVEKLRSAAKMPSAKTREESTASDSMPGIEQGVVKFLRKPAKMGEDHIFWIPRVYIKNGLVDPACEYEVYLKKR